MIVKKRPTLLLNGIGIDAIEFTVPKGTVIPSAANQEFEVKANEHGEDIQITIRHMEHGADVFEPFPPESDVGQSGLFKFLKQFSFPNDPNGNQALYESVRSIYLSSKKTAAELNPMIKAMDLLKQKQRDILKQAHGFIKNSPNNWPAQAESLLVQVQARKKEIEKWIQQYQADGQPEYEAIAKNLYQSLDGMERECEKILHKEYVFTELARGLNTLSDQGAGVLAKRLALLEKDHPFIRHNTIMAVLEAASALEKSALKQVFLNKLANLPAIDFDQQVQRLCASILDLKKAGLLSDYSADLLINQKFIDKSCQSRITSESYNFFGSASRDEYENKIMWSYYTQSVESRVAAMISSEQSLAQIFDFAAATRQNIARIRNEDYRFGEFRDYSQSMDSYSSQGKSVASKQIFPTLISVLQEQKTMYEANEKPDMALKLLYEADTTPHVRKYKFTPVLTVGESSIKCPEETVAIYYNDPQYKAMRSVVVIFEQTARASFNEALSAFDKHFLAKLRQGQFKHHDEFLTALGEFTFTMAKLYPLSRGSGAVTQWLVRGIVQYYTHGLISLNDVRLGNAKDEERVPYDIHAQVVQDPKQYVRDFKASLMPYFSVLEKSKDLLKLGGYVEKDGQWALLASKAAKLVKAANPYFVKKHDDLRRLAGLLNSGEPLDFGQLKKLIIDIKTHSTQYQKNKLSFFDSKIARQANDVLMETDKCLLSKK